MNMDMNMQTRIALGHRQRGLALVMGMLILIVLSILGITALSMTTLQETMTGNLRDQELAFQSAETALRDAERQLAGMQVACSHADVAPPPNSSIQVTGPDGQSVKVWSRTASGIPDPLDDTSWANATPYSGTLTEVAAQPQYTVEEIGFDTTDNTAVYRITARGVGGTTAARSVLQSYYRKSFDHVITITGTNGIDVVAIAENVLAAQLSVGGTIDVDVSLGGWQPATCPGTGEFTIYFDGNGGLDTFVVANLAEVNLPSIGGGSLQDITSSVSGLAYALTNFKIKRILVENPDSTVVTIANTNLFTTASDDNEYCINTGSTFGIVGDKTVLEGLLGGILTSQLIALLPPIEPVMNLIDQLLGGLIGDDGLIPLIPASASVIADLSGNDQYEIYTDTTTSAFVFADIVGDDSYFIRDRGDGLVNTAVILDTAGTDSFDVEGPGYLKLDVELSAILGPLTTLLTTPPINTLIGLINDLLNGQVCVNILIIPVCINLGSTVEAVFELLDDLGLLELLNEILGAVSDLFDPSDVPAGGTPSTFQAGLCAPEQGVRLSWREVRP